MESIEERVEELVALCGKAPDSAIAWFLDHYKITGASVASYLDGTAIYSLCAMGSISILRWLIREKLTYNLTLVYGTDCKYRRNGNFGAPIALLVGRHTQIETIHLALSVVGTKPNVEVFESMVFRALTHNRIDIATTVWAHIELKRKNEAATTAAAEFVIVPSGAPIPEVHVIVAASDAPICAAPLVVSATPTPDAEAIRQRAIILASAEDDRQRAIAENDRQRAIAENAKKEAEFAEWKRDVAEKANQAKIDAVTAQVRARLVAKLSQPRSDNVLALSDINITDDYAPASMQVHKWP